MSTNRKFLDTDYILYAGAIMKNVRMFDPAWAEELLEQDKVLDFLEASYKSKISTLAVVDRFYAMYQKRMKRV